MSTYCIEYAKSNRAACKGACKMNIAKGSLRFGTVVNRGEFNATTWRCFPQCTTKQVASNCLKTYPEIELLGGLSDLTEDDQKRVTEALEKISKGEDVEPWLGNAEEEGEEEEEDEKKTPKKKGKTKQDKEDEDDNDEEEEPKKKRAPAKKKTPAKKKKKASSDDDEESEAEKPKKKKAATKKPAKKRTKVDEEDDD